MDNEGCCGSVLLRTGFEDDAREIMSKTLKDLKGEKILVSCAGCYRAFKKDYPEVLGENVDVIHVSQLLNQLIHDGKIPKSNSLDKVTYHDPCHLGRHMGEYEQPRNVIKTYTKLLEMDRKMKNARCCGAGGGVRSAYPDLSSEIALRRVDDAFETGADLLVTCCPFCVLNLESKKLRVMDLTEFVLLQTKNNAQKEVSHEQN